MNYLKSAIKQFEYYKQMGERTFAQVSDEQLFWQFNSESNSIATIVKHLAGNMRSRWTDMLTTDGEKPDRDREAEFDNHVASRTEMLALWENGWQVLLNRLHSLHEADLDKTIYIRNEAHTVMEAINRQLAHYPYHVGQIVYIGKMCAADWHSLTIPRGGSASFNAGKFGADRHF